MDARWTLILENVNNFFALTFTIEAIVRIFAMRSMYFQDRMCVFDFVIVVGTDSMLLLKYTVGEAGGIQAVAPVMRAFRIARVLRLLRHAKGLRMISNTVLKSFPALANMFSLLLLLLFIYAVLGVALFGKIPDGGSIDHNANFRNFINALMMLIRSSTGEAWHMIMFDCARRTPGCNPEQSYEDIKLHGFNGCGNTLSYPYFTLVVVSLGWIALNLVIGVVIDGFIEAAAEEKLEAIRTQYGELMEKWYDEAVGGDGHIMPLDTLVSILETIDQPVGYKDAFPGDSRVRYRRIRMHLALTELHVYSADDVHIRDVAINVCVRLIERDRPDLVNAQKEPEALLSKSLLTTFNRKFPRYHSDHKYGVAHLMASNALNKLVKSHQERSEVKQQERNRLEAVGLSRSETDNAGLFAEDAVKRLSGSPGSLFGPPMEDV